MELRWITPDYAVSPQISPEDVRLAAEAGITKIICNRPDSEVEPSHTAAAIGAACKDAGIAFEVIPVTHPTLVDCIAPHGAALDAATGKVLAYCASGTRSTFVWALGQAGKVPSAQLIESGAKAGYDLSPIAQVLASQD